MVWFPKVNYKALDDENVLQSLSVFTMLGEDLEESFEALRKCKKRGIPTLSLDKPWASPGTDCILLWESSPDEEQIICRGQNWVFWKHHGELSLWCTTGKIFQFVVLAFIERFSCSDLGWNIYCCYVGEKETLLECFPEDDFGKKSHKEIILSWLGYQIPCVGDQAGACVMLVSWIFFFVTLFFALSWL